MYTHLKAIEIATLLGSGVSAHEQTPAYPKKQYSTVDGIVKFELSIFNFLWEIKTNFKRLDVLFNLRAKINRFGLATRGKLPFGVSWPSG